MIMPGNDGLCHISDMDWAHIGQVTDVMNLGDEVEVKVTNIDREGRIRLSRKELLPKPEGYVEPPPGSRGPGGGGDRGGDRGGFRGGDRGGRGGDRGRGGPRPR
jgi:polyribonucleotide nucleotidyltransferase